MLCELQCITVSKTELQENKRIFYFYSGKAVERVKLAGADKQSDIFIL